MCSSDLLVGGALVILGWSMAAFGTRSVVWLAGGALIIDLGTGLAHGANLSALQRRYPTMGGWVNAVYMVAYFVGGAAGAAIAPALYLSIGWIAVAIFATAVAALGVLGTFAWRTSLSAEMTESVG